MFSVPVEEHSAALREGSAGCDAKAHNLTTLRVRLHRGPAVLPGAA